MPEIPKPTGKAPEIAELDAILAPPDAENFSEATVKYEVPETRWAREARETANASHERLLTLLKLSYAGVLLLIFVSLGVYLFAVKSDSTEAQKLYAFTVLTVIASGSAGYAFGKKQEKSEKE